MRTVEDRPAFLRPGVTKFGIPTPRVVIPDVRHWIYSSVPTLDDLLVEGTPLYPTYAGRLVAVRPSLKVAGSTDTTGELHINGFSVLTFTIPASRRQGYRAIPRLRSRWGTSDYLEVILTAVGTDAAGPLGLILDHVRPVL